MHDRKVLVLELIRNPRVDNQVIETLAALEPHTGAALAVVSRLDVITTLRQFESGNLGAPELKAWAGRLVKRRDIEFEFGPEGALVDALYWLIDEEIADWKGHHVCEHIEAMLERRSRPR